MKNLVFISLLAFLCSRMFGQSETSNSPYFMVMSDDPTIDGLPLKSTDVKVNISGVIADVTVEQTYANVGTHPIEAIYIFPGSTSAAVYGMQMQVGQRILEAKIEEKNKAREIYTKAKEKGKRTSLLEQHRPNVFQMNVANIMPGDTIKVRLSYSELLIPESGIYQFVYPTVVGPRYVNGNEQFNVSYAAMPYQHSGDTPKSSFDLSVRLSSGIPIDMVSSSTHKINVTQPNSKVAQVSIQKDAKNGNRDFVLSYSLRGNEIESGLLLYEHGAEKYFLCLVQPPKNLKASAIPPREYIFVVDVSGSMNGFPLEVSKRLLNDLISGLRPTDMFNIILFAGGHKMLAASSLPASTENIQKAFDLISNQQGGGGTNLLPALKQSLSLPHNVEGISRSIVVVTDGYIGVEPEAFDLVRQNLNKANLFAFGIGSSVNRHLIEGLAYAGQGVPTIVLKGEEAPAAAEKFRQYIAQPVFTQITSTFSGFDAYDIEPVSIPDVLSERPVVIFGKWRGKAQGHISLTGFTGNAQQAQTNSPESFGFPPSSGMPGQKMKLEIKVSDATPDTAHSALRYLWARARLRQLADFNEYNRTPEQIKEITKLGLDYNLLTQYTSFVAVEKNVVREKEDSLKTVSQPLPMPEGVSDYAVGFTLNITGITGSGKSSTISIYLLFFVCSLFALALLVIAKSKRIIHVFIPIFMMTLLASCSEQETPISENISPKHRSTESVTFILGTDEDSSNTYYQHAANYYKQFTQDGTHVVIEHIRSLKALYRYLDDERPITGAWKNINLVVHGNRWTGIALPLDKKGTIRTDATSLQMALAANEFRKLSDAVINCDTRVEVLGCGTGLDRPLLNQFGHLFTNRIGEEAMIFASTGFNIFYSPAGNPKRVGQYEANCYYVAFPIEQKPFNEEIATALATRYPGQCIDWFGALQNPGSAEGLHPHRYQFHIPVHWTFLYEDHETSPTFKWQDQIRKWVSQQSDIMATLDHMGFCPYDFWWKAQASTHQINVLQQQPSLELKGSTRIYCVLVPIPSTLKMAV
jgi:hypothetical protein